MRAVVFGWPISSKFTRLLKIVFVDTPILGFAKITQLDGGLFNSVICSPRPVAKAVQLYTQNGTSVPIRAPISANLWVEIFKFHNRFKPLSTAAALLLPPPKPAETGILFSI